MDDKIIENIKTTLDKIRPFIQKDGGNVEFDSFDNGIVYIKMTGACAHCSYASITVKNTIETILLEEVPEVKTVKLVDEKNIAK